MVDYERAVAKKKKALFKELFQLLPPKPVILEVGIGFLAGVGWVIGSQNPQIADPPLNQGRRRGSVDR